MDMTTNTVEQAANEGTTGTLVNPSRDLFASLDETTMLFAEGFAPLFFVVLVASHLISKARRQRKLELTAQAPVDEGSNG